VIKDFSVIKNLTSLPKSMITPEPLITPNA